MTPTTPTGTGPPEPAVDDQAIVHETLLVQTQHRRSRL
jgi:hypothetical protein